MHIYLNDTCSGAGWKRFERNIEEDFESYSAEEFQNINGFLIRAAGEIFIDDLFLSGAETVQVYNVAPNTPGGIIMSCKLDGTPEKMWYHYDGIGNVATITDDSGQLLTGYDQEAFGTVYGIYDGTYSYQYGGKNGISVPGIQQEGEHLTTKNYYASTQMYHFNFRWYDPVIGRFIQQEPLGLDGPNQYHFCFNDPVNGYDPNGLWNISNPFTWGDPNSVDDTIWSSLNPFASGGSFDGWWETWGSGGTLHRLAGGLISGNAVNNSHSGQITEVENATGCEENWARGVMNGALITAGVAATTALAAGTVEFVFLNNQSISVFGHLWNSNGVWTPHIGLEYGNHLNLIHLGWHPAYNLHIALGAYRSFVSYHHLYICARYLGQFYILRYWNPEL